MHFKRHIPVFADYPSRRLSRDSTSGTIKGYTISSLEYQQG